MIKTTLKIDGMMCGMCEAHINDCIRNHFNVKKVEASRKKGECIILTEEEIEEDRLKKSICDIGYTLISVHSEPYVKKSFFDRKHSCL